MDPILRRLMGTVVRFAPDGESEGGGASTEAGGQGADTTQGGGGVDSVAGGSGEDTTQGGAAGADSTQGGATGDSLAGAAAKPGAKPWFQRRIDELTRDKHDLTRQAEALKIENDLLQGARGADSTGGAASTVAGGAAGGAKPARLLTQDDVQTEAQRIVAAERFTNACNDLDAKGKAQFGADWGKSLTNFAHIGGLLSEKALPLMTTVLEAENGPAILKALGDDLDRAAELMELPPVRLAREITKMDMEVGKPRKPSGAPAPAPIPGGGSKPVEKDPETMDDSEWAVWRKRDLEKKRKAGEFTPRY